MKSWKISHRLVFLALVPALSTAVFLITYYSARIVDDSEQALVRRGNAIIETLTASLQNNATPVELRALKVQIGRTLRETDVIRVEIRDVRGGLVFKSERPDVMRARPNPALEFLSSLVFNNRTQSFSTHLTHPAANEGDTASTSENTQMPADRAETSVGSVEVVLSATSTHYRELLVAVKGIGMVLIIMGVSTLLAFHLARSMSKPMEAMLKIMNKVQDGDLSSSIEITAGGEFGVLQQRINLVLEKIRVSHHQLVNSVKLATIELKRKIDEIKRKNRELAIARTHAEEANIAKSRFLANMSHELRTPMNAIIGFSDLLCEYKVDDAHDEYTGTIRRSAADLLILINEILDYAKIESGEFKIDKTLFNFYRLIDGIVGLLSKTAYEKNLEFFTYIDPDIPVDFISDPIRLKQAVMP